MAIVDAQTAAPEAVASDGQAISKRLDKARTNHGSWKPGWARNLAFLQGKQFTVIDANTKRVSSLETNEFGAKPRWRSRTVRNRIQGYVASEISMATSRVPGYEVTPSTTDPEDQYAARLAANVLIYLYDFLSMRKHLVDAYYYAVNCGEGFIRPYWNAKAGKQLPPAMGEDGQPEPTLYEGEICLKTYGPDQVYWEPGVRFEESKWHAIDVAMTLEHARDLAGFTGNVELKPDANGHASFVSSQQNATAANPDMVRVTEYLELPCERFPEGRRLMLANSQIICSPEAYPYVLHGPEGPEPALHKLSYFPTPDRERDMGLTEHLVDPQAGLNNVINKSFDWVTYAMNPQWVTGPAGLRDPRTTDPGAVFRSKTSGDDVKPVQVPVYPSALLQIANMEIEAMEEISSQRGVPAGLESAKALATLNERDNIRRAFITQNLADFHARLGKHLLAMVQKYWTDPRLVTIQGDDAMQFISDFRGADLRDQVSVRVLPGSIEPITKAAMEQKVMNFAQLGWITPEQAMAAIDNGTAEGLVKKFERNTAKQSREIRAMQAMGDESVPGGDIPIAAPFDTHSVHIEVLTDWMLTEEFEQSPPQVQDAANLHMQQHKMLEQQEQDQQAQQQVEQAQQLGMSNAARPTGVSGPPSLPAGDPGQ